MRLPIAFAAAVVVFSAWGVHDVRAELASIYVQAHGGYAGGDTEELMPGGADPALGPALGLQAGARILFLDGYLDRTQMIRTGAVSRAVLGLHGDLTLVGFRFMLRAGAGALSEEDGALSGVETEGTQRLGILGRAGGSVDREVASRLFLGFGLDGEVYALEGDRTGFDVMANLRLSFELGL
jgi:hypothetical protein